MLALELTARCQAILINAKFGVVSEFLEVCGHVLHLLIAFFQSLGAGFEAREAWMRRLLAIDATTGAGGADPVGRAAQPSIYKALVPPLE